MKKRIFSYNFILIVLLFVVVGIIIAGKIPQQESKYYRVGIAIYDMDDTYMQDYMEQLQKVLEEQDDSGKRVLYEILDAEGDFNRQQKQLQYMYSQKFDVLLINLVKPTLAASILNEAAERNIPVILFNRETEAKNLTISKEIWYVGTDAKAAGSIQGEMLTKLWKEKNAEVDRNKNGKLDYVLVEGEKAHFDAIRRTNGFLESGSDIQLNQLENISADWKRTLAFDMFSQMDKEIVGNTESVICHNDDIALGVYDYYKANQKEVPIILGINNNSEINEKIKSGEIYGTVDNDIEEQVMYMCRLMDAILQDRTEAYEKVWYSKPHAVID